MDKIIKWYNAGKIIYLTVTVGNTFSYNAALDVDNIYIHGNIINIMDIDLCVTDFAEIEDGLVYAEGNTTILLTI